MTTTTRAQVRKPAPEGDTVTVTARRWEHGWELVINGDESAVTQVTALKRARQQVIDYLDTVDEDVDHSTINVDLEVEGFGQEINAAKTATSDAAARQVKAATMTREAIWKLRKSGVSVEDSAAIFGVTRARAYQLLKK